MSGLSVQRKRFVDEYILLNGKNQAQAAINAGYSPKTAAAQASRLLKNVNVLTYLRKRIKEKAMDADEVLMRLADMVRADLGQFYKIEERWTVDPLPTDEIIAEQLEELTLGDKPVNVKRYLVRKLTLDTEKVKDPRYSGLLQEFSDSPRDGMTIKLNSKLSALQTLVKIHKLDGDDLSDRSASTLDLPADCIAESFIKVYRDIKARNHIEYVLYGGRGSTKSSFISLAIIYLVVNNPGVHGLAVRQVAETLRESVFNQLLWAIAELGLNEQFKSTVSPMQITYLPTGQKIYFRGADDPAKIKSIKPAFGYIGFLWLEELDQFLGEEAVRKIEQSVIRGGDTAYIFKSFNPPRTANNWANKYVKVPKATQYQHKSTYLDVPPEWLGKPWIAEAEHLKEVNPAAYEHEYGGEANGTGGMVFGNVEMRPITDEEIAQFDRIMHGLDWGYFPDPAAYNRMHYDAARLTLYIFAEFRGYKLANADFYDKLVEIGLMPNDLVIADSAEPKSIADFVSYGQMCRGAEKGPDSVDYSMKWLQSLRKIVIDNVRCPYTAQEFLEYELEQDKNGDFISRYPDKNNHQIDSVRYGTNLQWRQRGR
jgi:phage terminase large subunit